MPDAFGASVTTSGPQKHFFPKQRGASGTTPA